MGTASTKAKRKWNKDHYTNVTVAMNPELASKLKASCAENSVSVSSVIIGLVSKYLDADVMKPEKKPEKKEAGNYGSGRG